MRSLSESLLVLVALSLPASDAFAAGAAVILAADFAASRFASVADFWRS